MKRIRALVIVAGVLGASAVPASSAMAAGTYVSTTGTTVLGLQIPVVSTLATTLPVAVPGEPDVNVVASAKVGSLNLLNLNIDPHMMP